MGIVEAAAMKRDRVRDVLESVAAGRLPVQEAEEVSVTVDAFGCHVDLVVDVGVAIFHRLFDQAERLQRTAVLIVVAGMDGVVGLGRGGPAGHR